MDKKKLKQYIPLRKEQEMLDEKLNKLSERALDIPTVLGKETHMTVAMDEPKQADIIGKQMKINEKRKNQVDALVIEIEEFIADIPDSVARQIFELVFLEGKTQQDVGDRLGYTKGRVSQIISNYLKD